MSERNWRERLREAILNGVTTSAEIAHLIYSKLSDLASEHPLAIIYINTIVDELRDIIDDLIDTNPNTATWIDLFNMWLFEKGPNPIQFMILQLPQLLLKYKKRLVKQEILHLIKFKTGIFLELMITLGLMG
ncbi:hypothetical protein D7030_07570 [Flavobacteriaceae bacterium AU392]|nr:hypothetical protein D1817_00850 [Flavobacteriaceae bacterium]RKM84981.1 hypothetical protein D7030_07570 [Flavobacteriaceae bacterium AU392]